MTIRRAVAPGLDVFPLALGTNVFGWTADAAESHAVLDHYVAHGGNFIDTSDSYSFWAPGNSGGESESIIGDWLARRGGRADLVIASKVSQHPQFSGMAPGTINAAIDESLRRLETDVIDIYYAHFDDASTPLADSIAAMSGLVDAGKIRAIGVSNYTPERVAEWLGITEREGFHRPVALQPQYSLVERGIEKDLVPLALEHEIGILPYYALARGFLTGKYADGAVVNSPRAAAASAYLHPLGLRVLDALTQVAAAHRAAPASVALAWVAAQPGVTAPIASARNIGQLPALLAHVDLDLTDAELRLLSGASDPATA
jgi:aryl-alcohol dehydrogenase-like predicted oxidoreductase